MKSAPGAAMTLGDPTAARVRLIVWCHRLPPPDRPRSRRKWRSRYGAEMTVPDWRARLVCGECGSRRVDMVVSGTER
jgi:hypothetical protein